MFLELLFYASLIALSLGQLAVIYKQVGTSVYVSDLVVAVFALFGLVYFLVRGTLKLPKFSLYFLGFAFFAFASLVFNSQNYPGGEAVVAFLYWARWLSYLAGAIVLYNMFLAKVLKPEQVLFGFVASGLFVAAAGFVQLMVLPDFTTLDPGLGWDPHKNRLASTFFDPNFVGAYLVIVLAAVLGFFTSAEPRGPRLLYTSGVILFIALLLTFSRSAWLMLAVVVFIFCVKRYRKGLVIAVLLAFLAYYAVPRVQTRIVGLTDPADSARFRFESWKNAAKIIAKNPLIGVGFNAYRYAQREYGLVDPDTINRHDAAGADSSLLFVLATTGILGLSFYVLGLVQPLTMGVKQSFDLTALAVIAGLAVESQFINSLFYPPIMFALLSIFAIHSFFHTEP